MTGYFVRYRLNNRRIQLYNYISYCLAEAVFVAPGWLTVPIIYIIGIITDIVVRYTVLTLYIVVSGSLGNAHPCMAVR